MVILTKHAGLSPLTLRSKTEILIKLISFKRNRNRCASDRENYQKDFKACVR